jgi:hypothetical protein
LFHHPSDKNLDCLHSSSGALPRQTKSRCFPIIDALRLSRDDKILGGVVVTNSVAAPSKWIAAVEGRRATFGRFLTDTVVIARERLPQMRKNDRVLSSPSKAAWRGVVSHPQ